MLLIGWGTLDPAEMQREEKLLLAVPPQILARPDEAIE
jgi:hypothetical protein